MNTEKTLIITGLFLINSLAADYGYGYSDLLSDLEAWGTSPWVTVDSIGTSVQGRAIWELAICDTSGDEPRRTIYFHARTHPNEVTSFYATQAIIELLISDDPYSAFLRSRCNFYIVPMYNPDGVELEAGRLNANGIDLERNWTATVAEPEVEALRKRFSGLMASDQPIEISLNMHASSASTLRYFVYHHENGTSQLYASLEQVFIEGIRSYFPEGFEPWDFFVSWTGSTPDYYPESWWWLNHSENVMALTYEDVFNSIDSNYDLAALAIRNGIGDYLGLPDQSSVEELWSQPAEFQLIGNYPNPFNPYTTIVYSLDRRSEVKVAIYDLSGRQVAVPLVGVRTAGRHEVRWNSAGFASGTYINRLTVDGRSEAGKMVLLR